MTLGYEKMNKRKEPRILVGVMYCGEQEYAECIRAIETQKNVSATIFRIENEANKAAHDRLYAHFNDQASDFDLLVKVDADMVFRSPDCLDSVYRAFIENPSIDHLMIDVHDYLSDIPIPGQNFYSPRVRWNGNQDNLIVDYHGTYPGRFHRIMDQPITIHMPNPNDFQAFSFGIHRLTKAIQPDRKERDFQRALIHWTIISKIYDAYLRLGDNRRLLALGGALMVLDHPAPKTLMDYKSDELRRKFEEKWKEEIEGNRKTILRRWSAPLMLQGQWLQRFRGG